MSKYTMPPRQKMINLLYVILIAMLAINVSSDVLGGYKIMNENFADRLKKLKDYNLLIAQSVNGEDSSAIKSRQLSNEAQKLCNYLDNLQEEIARHADRDKYRKGKLKALDDLNAVPDVMLSALTHNGYKLKEMLQHYKQSALSMITNTTQKGYIEACLPLRAYTRGMSWEKETFSYLPAIGGITYLNQLKEQVLLIANDICRTVNDANGGGMSMSNLPQMPMKPGQHYVLINDGQRIVNSDGTVEGPVVQVAQVSSQLLYKNYENTLSLFCAGIPTSRLNVSIDNGRIFRRNNSFVAVPGRSGSAVIRVSYNKDGKQVSLAQYHYNVKSLSTPSAYLALRGGQTYQGNVPVSKRTLSGASHIGVVSEDGPKVNFRVLSFETVLIKANGKITTIHSSGASLSGRQREQIESIEHGDRFYITSIMVSGPDGRKQAAPIDVVVP